MENFRKKKKEDRLVCKETSSFVFQDYVKGKNRIKRTCIYTELKLDSVIKFKSALKFKHFYFSLIN